MIDIGRFGSKLGLKGINIGENGSSFNEQLLLLELFLDNGNRIRKLFVQVDEGSYDRFFGGYFHFWTYMRLLERPLVSAAIRQESNTMKYLLWTRVPFARFIEYNNIYRFEGLFENTYNDFKKLDSTYGSQLPCLAALQRQASVFTELVPQKYDIEPSRRVSLINMINRCKLSGIEVVLYTAPVLDLLQKTEENLPQMLEVQKKIAKQHDLRYFNFLTHEICFDKKYFQDYKHLNCEGTARFSNDFADSVRATRLF